jgi:hypothetical protein
VLAACRGDVVRWQGYCGIMRYPDGSGLSARARVRRESVRLQAAAWFAQAIEPPQVGRRLRISANSAYMWRWRVGGEAALASKGPGGAICRPNHVAPSVEQLWVRSESGAHQASLPDLPSAKRQNLHDGSSKGGADDAGFGGDGRQCVDAHPCRRWLTFTQAQHHALGREDAEACTGDERLVRGSGLPVEFQHPLDGRELVRHVDVVGSRRARPRDFGGSGRERADGVDHHGRGILGELGEGGPKRARQQPRRAAELSDDAFKTFAVPPDERERDARLVQPRRNRSPVRPVAPSTQTSLFIAPFHSKP